MQRLDDLATGKSDQVHATALDNLDLRPCREGVDALDADAVETAGDLVDVVVELSPGVHLGHDDLDGGPAVDRRILVDHGVNRHPPAVVDDGAGAVDPEADGDGGGKAHHHLVDGVVHALVDEVMQGGEAHAAHEHAGAFADCFQPLEHLDRLGGVVAGCAGGCVVAVGHVSSRGGGEIVP